MSKHLRFSEKWFNRGLWLISIIFAWFLIGLGGVIVNDLPKVEKRLEVENFIDQTEKKLIESEIEKLENKREKLVVVNDELEFTLTNEKRIYQNAKESHANWLSTRHATQLSAQDEELISRTWKLDEIKIHIESLESDFVNQKQTLELIKRERDDWQLKINSLYESGSILFYNDLRQQELRIFLYRLALTLPLLIVAGYLFANHRKKRYWPFVWGFIFFAFFAFFVELVPYLPSYGGYVRYSVGVILTLIGGHYAIRGLSRYLERQKSIEAQPEIERRKEISYDVSLARLSKGLCPGCERNVPLNDTIFDFCPHCGISLFNYCGNCKTRKSTFSHYCHACGTSSKEDIKDLI